MAREQFAYRESETLFKQLEELSRRSKVSRGQAFEDWLTAMTCALAAETMEPQYLAMVERHKHGKPGDRGVDVMGRMFGELVHAMSDEPHDILGDLFQGSISYGEAGQYFTPESVTQLMAQLTVDPDARPSAGKPILVNDPCCGTGRMLMEAARINPHVEVAGQDIDARCANITAINLGLRGLYGWVVCGNSLTCEAQFAYRIGSFYHESPHGTRRGVIREVPVEATPFTMISRSIRCKTSDLFEAEKPPVESEIEWKLPTIMEVPAWLSRLESGLAATGSSPAETNEKAPEPEPERPVEPRPQQGMLF